MKAFFAGLAGLVLMASVAVAGPHQGSYHGNSHSAYHGNSYHGNSYHGGYNYHNYRHYNHGWSGYSYRSWYGPRNCYIYWSPVDTCWYYSAPSGEYCPLETYYAPPCP